MKNIQLVLISFLLFGCTTMEPVKNSFDPQSVVSQVQPGDYVRIEKTDGSKLAFEVHSISTNSIKGNNVEIPLEQVKKIEKEVTEFWKTAGATYGVMSIIGLIVFVTSF